MKFLPSLVLSFLALFCGSCAMIGLHEDLAVIAETAEISGRVIIATATEHPLVVALYEQREGAKVLFTYWVTDTSGDFRFLVPPGTYSLFAFEDHNADFKYQPGESAVWYGQFTPLQVKPGSVSQGITLVLNPLENNIIKQVQSSKEMTGVVSMQIEKRQLGTIVQLKENRFGPEYAQRGLWEPVKFLEEPGAGLFFLQPYDKQKIPVLFIHGAGGFPQQWDTIIKGLDSSHFQPWVLQYPSGLRLGLIGEVLEKYLAELQMKYHVSQLAIVAHSMGGLVARYTINHRTAQQKANFVKLFITISTPWRGDPAAGLGVENSPLVIPSWHDMATDSPFLIDLHETALPEGVEFYLFFGYRGKAKSSGALSDGTVMLSSILDQDMAREAYKIYGFDEDHDSILNSRLLTQQLNESLNKLISPASPDSRRSN